MCNSGFISTNSTVASVLWINEWIVLFHTFTKTFLGFKHKCFYYHVYAQFNIHYMYILKFDEIYCIHLYRSKNADYMNIDEKRRLNLIDYRTAQAWLWYRCLEIYLSDRLNAKILKTNGGKHRSSYWKLVILNIYIQSASLVCSQFILA